MFIVQESVHADRVSRHETRAEAIAAIEEMIRDGLAEPGDFNIREIDGNGTTVRVFSMYPADVAADEELPLTEREREVLRLLADGLSNEEIGQRLLISEATVKVHIRHILAKLEADARAQAMASLLRQSLIA
jgi:ATP/maltotriose-dependent transcriptional regulator MalT